MSEKLFLLLEKDLLTLSNMHDTLTLLFYLLLCFSGHPGVQGVRTPSRGGNQVAIMLCSDGRSQFTTNYSGQMLLIILL